MMTRISLPIALLSVVLLAACKCGGGASAKPEPAAAAPTEVTTPSGLKYVDLKIGDGASPQPGQIVSVHYTGWLTNGTKFDSSRDRGQPFEFPIGQGRVIKG